MVVLYLTIVDLSMKNGQGVYALKTFESFARKSSQNLKIILMCPQPKDASCLVVLQENYSIEVVYLREKHVSRSIIWHFILQVQILCKLLLIGRVDALIYSLKPTMVAPLVYGKLFVVPIFLLVEGLSVNTIKKLGGLFVRRVGTFLMELNIKSSKCVYPAYLTAKKWVDYVRSNTDSEIIPCGVDFNVFTPRGKRDNSNLTIGYVGSFRREHLVENLFRAVDCFNVTLLLAGTGKEYANLANLAISSAFLPKVEFLGELNQKDLPDLFSRCDVMWGVNSINHWGVPIKCYEYLSCNKKVIYTKRDELNFISLKGYGFELVDDDPQTIELLISDLIDRHKLGTLIDNECSREFVRDSNNWGNFYLKISKDIESCLVK